MSMLKKIYPIEQSRLYRIQSKKKLAELLGIDTSTLITLTKKQDLYKVFSIYKGDKPRIIEKPQGLLEIVHSRLFTLFSRIEPPSYLYSGVKGRSYVSNAEVHVGRGRILKTDISKFYSSTTHRQVFTGLLTEFRCSGDIARVLADLCTYQGHVPTGSPISMPVAFFAHKHIFDALHAKMLCNNVALTVYVDDITLSGVNLMRLHMCPIKKSFKSVGLCVHKTKFFRTGPASVTGTIIKADKLCLPNRRHKRIVDGIQLLADEPLWSERTRLSSMLIGQVHEAANVDDQWRGRATGYLQLISKLGSAPSKPD